MKALAINGSPRAGGNTEYLLKKVLEPVAEAGIETELLQIGGKLVHGCIACYKCRENKNAKCAIANDVVNEYIAKMIEADAIILGSPAYFADVTTELKALIDRSGFVAGGNGRLFRRKVGAAVAVNRRGGAMHVFDTINHFFQITGFIIPGSTYWNFAVGREKGEVANDAEGLANIRDLGETIAWLLKKIR
jgi:multimeric flavodoxin WrbA